jgi:hypothetical protein
MTFQLHCCFISLVLSSNLVFLRDFLPSFVVFCELLKENSRIHSDAAPDIEFFSGTDTNMRDPTKTTEQGRLKEEEKRERESTTERSLII